MTDPRIISETTPDESLEPSKLLERWESDEGNIYMSFEEFITMTTQGTTKDEQTSADPVVQPTKQTLKNVIVLNDPPNGYIGVMYVTPGFMEKQHRDAEYWSERAINSLMWIRIMGFNDQTPSYDHTMEMVEVADCYEAHLFVGSWNDRDPSGMLRKQVSDKQMENVKRNVTDYHRAIEELELLKGVGVEPVETFGAVYTRIAKVRRDSLAKTTQNASDEEIVQAARLKEATKKAAMPW